MSKTDLSERLDRRQKKLFETSIFLGKLLLAGLFFRGIIYLAPQTFLVQEWLAEITSVLLEIIGFESSVTGFTVVLDRTMYEITRDCVGWKSLAAFTGLMFASSSLKEHYRFVIAGFLAIMLANIIRIFTTIYLSHTGLISFTVIHGTLWRWGLTAVVIVLWVYWLKQNRVQTFYTRSPKNWL